MNYLHLILTLGLLALPVSAFADEAAPSEGEEPAEDSEPSEGEAPTEDGEAPEGEAPAEPKEETPEALQIAEPASFEEDVSDAPGAADAVVEPTGPTGPLFNRSSTGYRSLLSAVSLSVGGGQLAAVDSGLTGSDSNLHYHQVELGVLLLPRLGLSASFMVTEGSNFGTSGSNEEDEESSVSLAVEPGLQSWEVSARLIPTPPYFPIRGYFRAGGGVHLMHVRVIDHSAIGLQGQRDERGAAGFAVLGLGAEIGSPNGVRGRAIPVTAGLVLEGGARIGGGGTVVAAPSADLGQLGRLDVGPWYFRAALKVSFWPSPKVDFRADES
jgi:hypothetical protein